MLVQVQPGPPLWQALGIPWMAPAGVLLPWAGEFPGRVRPGLLWASLGELPGRVRLGLLRAWPGEFPGWVRPGLFLAWPREVPAGWLSPEPASLLGAAAPLGVYQGV